MFMPARYTVLLPVGGPTKRVAARRALALLRASFPEGGTWIAQPNLEPTVAGWWFSKMENRDISDVHVLVSIDSEYGDPLDDQCVGDLSRVLRFAYRSAPESVYYIASHAVGVIEVRGT